MGEPPNPSWLDELKERDALDFEDVMLIKGGADFQPAPDIGLFAFEKVE